LYRILFYRDRRGHEPVLEYIDELNKKNSKDSKIKLSKILDYINILETYGTVIGEPYVKSLGNSIWELRPLRDRILFVSWHEDAFVLLHVFMKKTQKTPPAEIEKAKREFADYIERSDNDEHK